MKIGFFILAFCFISFSFSSEGATRNAICALPQDVHISVWHPTREEVPGGLVDDPVYVSVYGNLKGLRLVEPDEFTIFKSEHVYHDDFGDYSTNEPMMDRTADAIFMMAFFGEKAEK